MGNFQLLVKENNTLLDGGLFGMSSEQKYSRSDTNASIPLTRNKPQNQRVICNRGFIYHVRVPREDPQENPISLTASEYERLLARVRGPSFLEKEKEAFRKASQKRKDDTKAAEERRRQIIDKDLYAFKVETQTDMQSKRQGFERYRHMRCKAQMEKDNQILRMDIRIQKCKIQAELDTQLQWKKQCEAVEYAKEKAEFERELNHHQEMLIKHEEKEIKRKVEARHHLDVLSGQIREREQIATANRRERIAIAQSLNEDDRMKIKCLDELKEERLAELKASGIPDKYCNYVRTKTTQEEAKRLQFQYLAQ
ncbi:uncharacterized protein [Nerophis lumbriciformis]|uniref:uncharacterized protein n=1 Tax=Nerophis lumbriciformis TaxID=546530 RepID=UPI002AE01F9A|nr:cilia- and flagella-associated protein 45-like [Nerophis lumbriciformis]